jgi:hypothetical protein
VDISKLEAMTSYAGTQIAIVRTVREKDGACGGVAGIWG